jgi:hypothetical protein
MFEITCSINTKGQHRDTYVDFVDQDGFPFGGTHIDMFNKDERIYNKLLDGKDVRFMLVEVVE